MLVRGGSTLTKYAAQIHSNSRTQSGFYDWFMALKNVFLFLGEKPLPRWLVFGDCLAQRGFLLLL